MPDAVAADAPWRLGAAELRAAYARRELSPVEVVDAAIERMEAVSPRLNAVVTPTPELARAQAAAAEREYARAGAEAAGALLGVPITVKDNLPTRGIRTTMGSLTLADWVPDADALVVERARAAGAAILGKTNTCEFGWKGDAGNRVFGPTANPWDGERTAGGSSGGAAAAVATGIGPVGLGTDGAGSLRIPASFCGVVGFKASHGTVPIAPRGAVGTLSHHGPVARSVADVALALSALAGPDPRDRLSDPRRDRRFELPAEGGLAGLRVAWCPTLGYARPDADVLAAAERGAAALAELGAVVEEVDPGLADPHEALWTIFEVAQAIQHADDLDAVAAELDPGRLRMAESGVALTAVDLARAARDRDALHQRLMALMADWDLLATPTMAVPPFAPGLDHPPSYAGEPTGGFLWSPYTYPFNLTGQPAVSLPCGHDRDGLPVGLQLVGRWRDDETVLAAAAAFERARPWAPIAPGWDPVPASPPALDEE